MPDEMLDIVNDDDQVTGQETRKIVHQRGLQHRGVHIFLVTADGKLIVQQRGSQRGLCPLALDCSVSEHVKAGESYPEAARRGLAEELGIQHARLHALVKFKMEYGPNDMEISQLYEGGGDPAQVQVDPIEVEKIACYSLDELEALIQNREAAFSGWFVELIHWYLGKPSRLQVLKNFTRKRLLEHT
jgi:16S rRNA (adenine1518-N6/adenine1519-N6)-dimethyltransferase